MRSRAARTRLTQEHLDGLKDVPGFAGQFLADGKAPAVGTVLKQEALAETLAHLAHAGLDDFYRGDVGREIAADLERIGSPLTRHDLERYHATLAEPLRVALPSGTVYNTDAPTQGVVSLMILALFARLGVTEAEGFDHIHGLVEATKRALRMRDRVVTDPNYLAHALDRVLDDRFIAGEAMKIDRSKAARWPLAAGAGDTIWMGAADSGGPRRVLYPIALLGIRLGLRAAGDRRADAKPRRELFARSGRAELSRARPAAVPHAQSRRSPCSRTAASWPMAAWAATASRRRKAPCSRATSISASRSSMRSTGRAGCSAAPGARRAPRCAWKPRFDGNLIDRLAAAGHDVEVIDEPYSDVMGHAGAVVLHPDGSCEGAHDPRADGGAAGI